MIAASSAYIDPNQEGPSSSDALDLAAMSHLMAHISQPLLFVRHVSNRPGTKPLNPFNKWVAKIIFLANVSIIRNYKTY